MASLVWPSFSTCQLSSATRRRMRKSLAPVCGPPPVAWTTVTIRSPGLRSLAWIGNSMAWAAADLTPANITAANITPMCRRFSFLITNLLLLKPRIDYHASMDHRRRHVFVTQQFLNRTDVIAILQHGNQNRGQACDLLRLIH